MRAMLIDRDCRQTKHVGDRIEDLFGLADFLEAGA
jgi:hypothetical protein